MAFPDPFRFSMRPNDTQWYYWDNGILNISDTVRYIEAPYQWKKTGAKWKRSYEQRGLIRALAAPYQFVLDGAAILRSLYINGSIDNKVYFLIEKLDEDTLEYYDFFPGEIDLSTYLDGVIYNNGSRAVSATVIEGGISALLDAVENIPYQIILDSDADIINMDGIKVRMTQTYGTLGSITTQNMTVDPTPPGGVAAIPFSDRGMQLYTDSTLKEGEYSNGITGTETDILMKNTAFASGSAEHNNEIYEASGTQDVTITINPTSLTYTNANYVGGNSGTVKMRVGIIKFTAATLSASRISSIIDTGQATLGNTRTWPFPGHSFSTTLATGDRLYITYDVVTLTAVPPTVGSYGFDYPALDDAVNIGVAFRLPTTDCKAYRYAVVVQKYLEQVTGISGVMESSFFANASLVTKDCRPYNVRLTCGDALRRIERTPSGAYILPTIRLTWAELKKDMHYRFGLGIDIRNNKVVIEEAGSFFNESQTIAHLGEVRTMTVEPARDYFATSQKWGYTTKSEGKLNGRDDALTTEVWKWPQTRVQKDEDCLCPFVTSMYAIEAARANLINKKTTDATSDNDTFCIETEATPTSGKYNLYRPQNTYTQPSDTGLLFKDTAYNLTMSPKRNLLRNGKFIRSTLYNLETQVLTFQTTDKNPEMNVNLGSGAISEKAAIVVSTLDSPVFKPFLFHVDAITSIAMKQEMDAKPGGCFAATSQGVEYKGFPIDVGIDGDLRNSYQMTLLCTASTDVAPLVIM